MTAPASPSPFATTVDALEARSRVPLEEQVETQVAHQIGDSTAAWDEERRQARLAGGA